VKLTISAADFVGSPAVISIANPAPGGGLSNELLFTVRRVYTPLVRR
jgi:hypothetical protein